MWVKQTIRISWKCVNVQVKIHVRIQRRISCRFLVGAVHIRVSSDNGFITKLRGGKLAGREGRGQKHQGQILNALRVMLSGVVWNSPHLQLQYLKGRGERGQGSDQRGKRQKHQGQTLQMQRQKIVRCVAYFFVDCQTITYSKGNQNGANWIARARPPLINKTWTLCERFNHVVEVGLRQFSQQFSQRSV
jgi:hypothetical protein